MPDFEDFDFNHDGTPDDGHDDDHGFFGHGGFVNINHFEHPGFFSTPSKSKGGDLSGLAKALIYVLYGGGVILIGLITCFILFS